MVKLHGRTIEVALSPGPGGQGSTAVRAAVASALASLQRSGSLPKGVTVNSHLVDRVACDLDQGFCGVCRQEGVTCSFDVAGECAVHEVMSR